jgi:PKHD-type hydroxylase
VLICIPDVLSSAQVAAFRGKLEGAAWVDGRETAGVQSATAKHNTQLPEGGALSRELGDVVLDALAGNALFLSAALPLKIFPPLFNRYGVGDGFGAHVDNAIRAVKGAPVRVRTDLSATLFLSDPETYEGGELVIETQFGGQAVKLEAGALVLYPASSLHSVVAITRGERFASFFWLQSMVRDDGERTLLFDLDQAVQALAAERGHGDPEVVRLTGVYHNLVRRWSDV